MRRSVAAISLSALAVLLPDTGLRAEDILRFTADEKILLERGEIIRRIERSGTATAGTVFVAGLTSCEPTRVWNLLTDYSQYRKIFPDLLEYEVRYSTLNHSHNYSVLDYPWPLEDKWVLTDIKLYPERWTIEWSRLDGTVKESNGFWLLRPYASKTLIVYQVRFDPGLKLIPEWLMQMGKDRLAPRPVQRIREVLSPFCR